MVSTRRRVSDDAQRAQLRVRHHRQHALGRDHLQTVHQRSAPRPQVKGHRRAPLFTAVAVPRSRIGPSKSWLAPANLAVLLTHCGQLILLKISKSDATRYHTLRLKCTTFHFRWGSAPDPAGKAYTDPLAVFKGPTSNGEEGGGLGRGKWKGKGRGREGNGQCLPKYFGLEPPLSLDRF